MGDAKEDYFEHLGTALYFAFNSLLCFVVLILHGVFPFMFVTTGSDKIKKLFKIMSKRAAIADLANFKGKKVAIIGFGASGLASFYNLIKMGSKNLHIDIYDGDFSFGRGVAYSTTNFHHLLNVRAENMSIDSEDPLHFFTWLSENGYNYGKKDFVPRVIYGVYLQDVFRKTLKLALQKGFIVKVINEKVEDVNEKAGYFCVKNGIYHDVILAKGVAQKAKINPYDIDLKKFLTRDEIHIRGAGLTAIDTIFSILDRGFKGKIFLYSRSGRFILPHSLTKKLKKPVITLEDVKNLSFNQLCMKFISACKKESDWRSAFDSIRPITQEIWQNLPESSKSQFMSRFLGLFNLHRHRCSEAVFKKLQALIKSRKLKLVQAQVPTGFINCSGLDFHKGDKLISNLLRKKIVKKDGLGGFYSIDDRFIIIGGLNFGKLFETIAIPEIRVQAKELAEEILK